MIHCTFCKFHNDWIIRMKLMYSEWLSSLEIMYLLKQIRFFTYAKYFILRLNTQKLTGKKEIGAKKLSMFFFTASPVFVPM